MADEVHIYDDEDEGVPETGAIERVVHEMSVGAIRAVRERDRARAKNLPREIELQFQSQISGTATPTPNFEQFTVNFDYALHYAPDQRESTLEEPHFSYGSVTTPPTAIHATVAEWLRDETNGSIIGAVVAVCAIGSEAFTGLLHLTFQGFGTLAEEDETPMVTKG